MAERVGIVGEADLKVDEMTAKIGEILGNKKWLRVELEGGPFRKVDVCKNKKMTWIKCTEPADEEAVSGELKDRDWVTKYTDHYFVVREGCVPMRLALDAEFAKTMRAEYGELRDLGCLFMGVRPMTDKDFDIVGEQLGMIQRNEGITKREFRNGEPGIFQSVKYIGLRTMFKKLLGDI